MDIVNAAPRGLVLLGCGKMGSAMLSGWLKQGFPADKVWVLDPAPSEWVNGSGVRVNEILPDRPSVVLVAVKPQMMGDALPAMLENESYTLRPYDTTPKIRYGQEQIVETAALPHVAQQMLADPDTAFVDVRNPKTGCYQCRIHRH